jgi:hypothetical protein
MDTSRDRPGLRRALRRLSHGFVVYGVIGLIAAALGLAVLVWADGRVSAVADSVEVEVAQMTLTLDRTADTLHNAGAMADSFAGTLERTPGSVRQAARTVRDLQPNLEQVGLQLGSFELFGTKPLDGPARLFAEMATGLRDLDTELELIAADLDTDRTALTDNARSLTEAGDQAAILADRVRAGFIQDGFDDIRTVLAVLVFTVVALAAMPAGAALALGIWLRRTFAVDEVGSRSGDVTTLQRAGLTPHYGRQVRQTMLGGRGDAQRRPKT